jgi:uncharacterized protein YjbI with pentapeptide repeats
VIPDRRRLTALALLACGLWWCELAIAAPSPAGTLPCEGKFAGRGRPSEPELARIIEGHGLWLRTGETRAKGSRANLCQANLTGLDLTGIDLRRAVLTAADLSGAHLPRANLGGVDLRGATLAGTDLDEATLDGADLRRADLGGARLVRADLGRANLEDAKLDSTTSDDDRGVTVLLEANLREANLRRASLVGVRLTDVDLTGANLYEATLRHARLVGVRLKDADVRRADLDEAIVELEPGSLPVAHSVALAQNLSGMRYERSPGSLIELREMFQKDGLRTQEREVTFAIRHTRNLQQWHEGPLGMIESLFNWLLFDVTTRYGMVPGRPLRVLMFLIPLFALVYLPALLTRGRAGIWAVPLEDRVHGRGSKPRPVRLGRSRRWLGAPAAPGARPPIAVLRLLRLALFFSVLSAFHLGWRDLNVGSWISRLQRREYTLRGTGWVRTVAGIESLVSVYLIAMWALAYFGRPFE